MEFCIRSLDEISKKTLTKFANNVFQNTISTLLNNGKLNSTTEINISLKGNLSEDDSIITLEDFLNQQEDHLIIKENLKSVSEQIIEIRNKVQQIDDDSKHEYNELKTVTSYNVKTIRVVWENNKHSFMHVFVDMTSVQNLEKVKATNKWQQLMFSSVSHEF